MEYTVSIPALARENVRISYATVPTFDPKGGKPQTEMHERHVSLPSLDVTTPKPHRIFKGFCVYPKKRHPRPGLPRNLTRNQRHVIQFVVYARALEMISFKADRQMLWLERELEDEREYLAWQKAPRPDFKITINTRTIVNTVMSDPKRDKHGRLTEDYPLYITTQEFDEPLLDERENDQAQLGHNFDLPDKLAFVNMGSNDRDNIHLDHKKMDDRCFRELCYVPKGGKKNMFLFLMGTHDLREKHALPKYLRAEWVSDFLLININLAYQIVDCIKRLAFDEKIALTWLRRALMSNAPLASINELLMLADEADKVTIVWENFISMSNYTPTPAEEERDDDARAQMVRHQDEPDFIGDDLDRSANSNPYTACALEGNGLDSCSHAFIEKIKHADWQELKTIMAGFYSQTSEFTGRTSRPKYHNFSYQMKSHAWTYIHERRAYLKQQFKQKRKNAVMSALVAAHAHLFERGNRNADMMAWEME